MKTTLAIFTLLSSISSFACPDITGKYLCPVEAEEITALGTRAVQFKKSPYVDIYSMKLGNDSIMFEVGSWNPGINPNTGDVDHLTETMAECKGNTVILNVKETVNEGDISITVAGSFDVTKIANGINLSLKTEDEELHKFDCIKQ
jgi:hypothetical protein